MRKSVASLIKVPPKNMEMTIPKPISYRETCFAYCYSAMCGPQVVTGMYMSYSPISEAVTKSKSR